MKYQKPPALSLNQIDKIGERLVDPDLIADHQAFLDIHEKLWAWRVAHHYPLNGMHMTLRKRARKADEKAFTAQRLKRQESIVSKLARTTTGTMQLSQMQDIGGCRAVVRSMNGLRKLQELYENKPLRHSLRKKDYTKEPRADGYRSVHLMYRFAGVGQSLPWDKMRIELQLRTQLQHAWATAVETVNAFTSQDLKHGNGSAEWTRFFSLMASANAMSEGTSLVPGTPSEHGKLVEEIKELENTLNVTHILQGFAAIAVQFERSPVNATWHVMELRPDDRRLTAYSFTKKEVQGAREKLQNLEQSFAGTRNMAVMVAVSSMNELRKAYPNYFADTLAFSTAIQKLCRGELPRAA